ncbi:MAG: hypothetical protein QOF57_450 [Frankiaceae bacterium]|nr:hypothetical protein [Frankiaceae bacterium]
MRRHRLLTAVLVVVCGTAVGLAVAQVTTDTGRIGPDKRLLDNGRRLSPFGKRVTVGQFPTGGALTRNGRYYWTVSTGRGENDVRIVSVRSGRVLQTLRLPGASGGIVMDPESDRAYVSGVHDSIKRAMQETPDGTPGKEGDILHDYTYNPRTGSAKEGGVIAVPPPSDAPVPQDFPPTNTKKIAWPDRLAIAPDGKTLLVPLNLADAAAIVDVASKKVRYVKTGNYPYGAAILRDGKRGLVSNETPGTVSVIDLAKGEKIKDIQVGAHLSHPEAIAVDPKADRAYVAVSESDQVAVIDTKALTVERTLAVGREEGLGASPIDLTVSPDGGSLLVANAGTDDIAVFRLPGAPALPRTKAQRAADAVLAHEASAAQRRAGKAGRGEAEEERAGRAAAVRASEDFALVGRIPTAQYPADVEVAPARANPCGFRTAKRRKSTKKHKLKYCAKVLYVSGKDLGTGPNPRGPQPNSKDDTDNDINATQYLPLLNVGAAGIGDFPTTGQLAALTKTANAQVVPINGQQAPEGTPLRPDGPIKHVFYIVRENRSYDQILGDDPRGDGDPKLTLFGGDTTPKAHALAQRFPLLDHVYANSEASIDGHFWTSAARVSDYVNKNWFQNYAGRDRPYDFGVYSVTWPASGFLFDQAEKQGISYFNYGEAIAGTVPLADKDRTPEETQEVGRKFGKSDLGPADLGPGVVPQGCYPNDASIGEDAINGQPIFDGTTPTGASPQSASRTACFRNRFAAQVATDSVPAFNYLVLTNDHTQTLSAGKRTPRAMIADNDHGLGQIVETISKSAIWKSSAIFVIEDDSQDGADHVDAHRIPAFVISPFAKQGAVVHNRYDFLSVIRSMELITGLKPLGLFDALATPMYDAFQPDPSNDAPFTAVEPKLDLLEKNPSGTRGARVAAGLPKGLDQISQPDMDRLLWWSVHGNGASPPPPGPNADGNDRQVLAK